MIENRPNLPRTDRARNINMAITGYIPYLINSIALFLLLSPVSICGFMLITDNYAGAFFAKPTAFMFIFVSTVISTVWIIIQHSVRKERNVRKRSYGILFILMDIIFIVPIVWFLILCIAAWFGSYLIDVNSRKGVTILIFSLYLLFLAAAWLLVRYIDFIKKKKIGIFLLVLISVFVFVNGFLARSMGHH